MKKSRYTVKGDELFDQMLDKFLDRISKAVEDSEFSKEIAAVILGGGYGRGEGGVFICADGNKKLYNDLDLFIITRNLGCDKINNINKAMSALGKQLTEEIGVDIDFGPAKNIRDLSKLPFTMMWQELREGHIVIYGNKDILDSLPDYSLNELPFTEGVRLLLNRGTGLLFAKKKLEAGLSDEDERDFIGRNLYKAALACGDVFLLANHKYSSSTKKRFEIIESFGKKKLDEDDINLYREAVEFKFSPEILPMDKLNELYDKILVMFEKACFSFFSLCYNLPLNTLWELKSALSSDSFSKHSGIKEIIKNFVLNMVYMRKLDRRFSFSTVNPRLELFGILLGLLFEDSKGRGYNNFLRCWQRFN
jgi:hypothetical protein